VRIDEHNHHTYLRPRIGRVNGQGQFDILQEAERWVRPDPYLVSHSLQTGQPARRFTPGNRCPGGNPMRKSEGTPRLLRELRSLRVLVFHPDDQDGQECCSVNCSASVAA